MKPARPRLTHLARDLRRFPVDLGRRGVLGMIAGASLLPLVGCTSDGGGNALPDLAGTGGADLAQAGSCAQIPPETEGPYPGDGTNGPNALTLSGIVRKDIRASLGGASGVATGVPLTVNLTIVDVANGCAALSGYALYLWHCDAAGNYSMYSPAAVNESYLRGVQVSDAAGLVSFTTVFPGCYAGRWPHLHFEVFPSVGVATSGTAEVATSQLAFPEDVCDAVYGGSGYPNSASNLSSLSAETDGIFANSLALQVAAVSGDVVSGYVASLTVGVNG